jgi:hypothetical protein
MLSIYPPGVMPVRCHLRRGANVNPHGFGWALQDAGRVHLQVGLRARPVIDNFVEARRDYRDGWAMFHSRHGTIGPGLLANCQPLRLADRSVLAHVGHLFDLEGDVSDTRVFCDALLPYWDLTQETDRRFVEDRLGRNRIAIMAGEGAPIILNEALGLRLPDGTWHSSADFTGASHLAAGRCSSCNRLMRGAPEASQCEFCLDEARERMTGLAGVKRANRRLP